MHGGGDPLEMTFRGVRPDVQVGKLDDAQAGETLGEIVETVRNDLLAFIAALEAALAAWPEPPER